jgi:ATP phosphoribosyltransferase regulatory subunit
MVYQPPTGARDLLPLDVAQQQWIDDRLQQVFHRWSYHRIITSTLERMDTLMAGGAIDRSSILQLHSANEEALGLRPELTASIARAAVTRMMGRPFPQRLYYNANVFARPTADSHSAQQEFYQAGVELLGSDGALADAEMLLLVMDCLENLGLGHVQPPHQPPHQLPQWQIIVGEAGLTRSLLSVFPENCQDKVRHAIAQLDLIGLDQVSLPDDLRDRARQMLDLRGRPDQVLKKVSGWDLSESQRQQVNHLKTLFELLRESLPTAQALPIVLDLSLIQTFDYYTGLVFEVASQGSAGQHVLGQGGRYDQLLGVYHPQGESVPGIGFSLHIDKLHQILLDSDRLPQQVPHSDWLVVARNAAAAAAACAHAKILRSGSQPSSTQPSSTVRVELSLAQQSPAATITAARDRGIGQIAWVDEQGNVVVEAITEETINQ